MKLIGTLLLIALLVSVVCLPIVYFYYKIKNEASEEDFFFGVSFGLNTTSEAKLLIDKVKGYTNLFVINSWDVTINKTALNEICEYAVNAEMHFMVFFDLDLSLYLSVAPYMAGHGDGKMGKQILGHLPLRRAWWKTD